MQLLQSFWPEVPAPAPLVPVQTFFYEVVPSAQVPRPPGLKPSYAAKVELCQLALQHLVPGILAALDVDTTLVSHSNDAGGYKLRTNPSIQTYLTVDDPASRVVAAALGWVFRQESVLVADLLDHHEGRTGYVTIDFGPQPLPPERSQEFFELAATIDRGLGGGYTAFHGDLLFLNVRDERGRPRSGLADERFAEVLQEAAQRFGHGARVDLIGVSDARFEDNDWSAAPEGEQYGAVLGPWLGRLEALRREHTEMVKRWIAELPRSR